MCAGGVLPRAVPSVGGEGGEADVQLTTAWLLYNIWEVARDTLARRALRANDGGPYGLGEMDGFDVAERFATMRPAEGALRLGEELQRT